MEQKSVFRWSGLFLLALALIAGITLGQKHGLLLRGIRALSRPFSAKSQSAEGLEVRWAFTFLV
jgi:hypothetical protein